MTWACF